MIEQETSLNYDPNTGLWYIWTNEMKWRNWIRKYAESHPNEVIIDKEDPKSNAIAAHFPKAWMRMPKPKREPSEKQLETLRANALLRRTGGENNE